MTDILADLHTGLANFSGNIPLRAAATKLLNILGYSSERTAELGSVEQFLKRFPVDDKQTKKQCDLFESWTTVDIVFQFTTEDVVQQSAQFDQSRIESFLFLTVDMMDNVYTRAHLAETTRAVNRLFAMPVILLFRHGSTLTLSTIHRRTHKLDNERDVLERVTLLKDIRIDNPHRAHTDILTALAFPRMRDSGISSFDELHEKWEQTLDIEMLNKGFYHKLFTWFERAANECTFPNDGAGEGNAERHVIRLITRLLFIWFLKEKGLVPEELFEEEFARSAVRNYSQNRTGYYRAVLQNLFFATLNTEIDRRSFGNEVNPTETNYNKYRYLDLLTDPDTFVKFLEKVPFVNGGLFDCLDDFGGLGSNNKLIDAFTDNPSHKEKLHVPANLFFDKENGLFPLFGHYKFTIEESTPLDREVALDPELLGRVFENLLATYNPETRDTARKTTGSYYTPRPVVDYMVREALTETLATVSKPTDNDIDFWRARLKYLFDHSDAMNDADDLFGVADKRAIVAGISEIRTLDPAVGSGAFLIGILQTLTLALRRIDPDNVLWEEVQKERAQIRAAKAFDTLDQSLRDEALHEISATFEKYRQSDFGRKLYLMQNGIYGVDIQPIACQIAKLRFFISLIIEQDPDPNAPNFGIKPLPNLETKLVAANSLLSLKIETDSLLQPDAVATKQKEVSAIRERYFLADSRPHKLRCIETEKLLLNELREILKADRQEWITAQERSIENTSEGLKTLEMREKFKADKFRKLAMRQRKYDETFTNAHKIVNWDPYNQNSSAQWFDPEYMFGVTDNFDVVIGNPPYIQLQKDSGHAGKLYQDAGYKTFQRTGDIYQLFYERGCNLLKPYSGILTYITSNSWLKAKYGRSLRNWFAEHHTPLQLVEMGRDVFENVIVDTAVLIVRNGKSRPVTCHAVDIEQTSSTRFPPPKGDWGTLQPEGERPWMALSSVERTVMEKMEAVGTPLKQWDISIYRGILTGFNAAFIVDQATKDSLVATDSRSAELLRPILRGRDIARYRANWAGLWLIDTHNGYDGEPPIDVNEYPAVKAHLGRFIQRLERRQDKGITPYNLRNCAYHESFAEEKLFWMDLTPEGKFSYGPAGTEMYCANTVYFMHGPMMKRLAAFLNSSLITWYVNKTTVTSGMGTARWFAVTVENIPIPRAFKNGSELDELVDDFLAALDQDATGNIQDLECAIEDFVFGAYGITENQQCVLNKTKND